MRASKGGWGSSGGAGTGLGLRGRVLVWLGLGLVAVSATLIAVEMLGVPFTPFEGAVHDTRQRVYSKLRLVADTKAERLLRWLEERRDDIGVIAAASVTREAIAEILAALEPPGTSNGIPVADAVASAGSYEPLRSALADIRDQYGVYDLIAIAAVPSGVVVVSTDDALVGTDLSTRPVVVEAVHSGRTVLLPRRSDAGGELELVIARAITFEADGERRDTVRAVVIARVRPDDILTPLLYTGGELGETGEVLLVDGGGSNLAELRHPLPGGERAAPLSTIIHAQPVTLAMAGEDGVVQALDHRGESVLAAYRHLELPGGGSWGLVIKQDVAEALAPVWRRFYLTSAFAACGTLAILGLAAFVLTTLTRPLRELSEVADRVRRGDLEARTPIPSSGELAAVGSAFNAMLERLQSRHEEAEGSALLFRRLLDRSGEEIYVIDTDGRIVDANQTAFDRLGYERDELHSLHITDIVEDSGGEEPWRGMLAGLAENDRLVAEGRHVCRDGSTYPVETTIVRQDVGAQPYVLAVTRDISERQDAEKERRRLATAVEQSADAVIITDTEGHIQYVNSAFEEISGYTRDDAIGRNPRILKSGEHDDALYDDMWETITAGRPWQGKLVNRTREGRPYRVETTITPMQDEAGRITNFVAVQHDVTHREEMEAQLRQAQKMEGVGQLAAGIAHDFNNLLTGITGYSQLLRSHVADGPQREDLDKIFDLAQQAASLTRQLLVFSRRAPTAPVPMNLNDVVDSTFKLVGRLIGEDIEVVQDLADDLGTVRADPGQIEQIVVNLCVNARDAMPGGGRLNVRTENVELDEEFARHHLGADPGPHVRLSVSDTGIGMDAATRERVFEPFFTTKELGHGTGLGLATVHGIVQQHGGTIWVDSTPGEGTTFSVYLPRVEGEPRKPGRQMTEELPSGTETILVVEDEDAVRAIVQRMLEARGYTVITAADPREALDTFDGLEAGTVDLLVTDVVMPEASGRRLADELRERVPDLKVLFMSGYTERTRENRGGLDPGVPFLQKPFTPGSLARAVREVLDAGAG